MSTFKGAILIDFQWNTKQKPANIIMAPDQEEVLGGGMAPLAPLRTLLTRTKGENSDNDKEDACITCGMEPETMHVCNTSSSRQRQVLRSSGVFREGAISTPPHNIFRRHSPGKSELGELE